MEYGIWNMEYVLSIRDYSIPSWMDANYRDSEYQKLEIVFTDNWSENLRSHKYQENTINDGFQALL